MVWRQMLHHDKCVQRRCGNIIKKLVKCLKSACTSTYTNDYVLCILGSSIYSHKVILSS
nr:hypothetical protein [uncultured bacterium]